MDTLNDLTLSNSTRTLPHLEELKLWYSHNKTTSNLSTQSRKTTNLTSKRKIYPLHMFALTCCPSLKSFELHKVHFILYFFILVYGFIDFQESYSILFFLSGWTTTLPSSTRNFSVLSSKYFSFTLFQSSIIFFKSYFEHDLILVQIIYFCDTSY